MNKIILGCLLLVLFVSCGKKESSIDLVKRGCTVKGAVNYDSTAIENNGSCIYPAQGPKNGTFEDGSIYDARHWLRFATNDGSTILIDNYCKVSSVNATQGNLCFYLAINKGFCSMAEISQKEINLAKTKELIFDFKSEVSVNSDAAIEILFTTSSGTVNLKTVVLGFSQSVRDEKITISDIYESGTLSFRLKGHQSNDFYCKTFIDNIRTVLK